VDPILILIIAVAVIVVLTVAFGLYRRKRRSGSVLAAPDTITPTKETS
jgi:septation ring formation regulator EzrA